MCRLVGLLDLEEGGGGGEAVSEGTISMPECVPHKLFSKMRMQYQRQLQVYIWMDYQWERYQKYWRILQVLYLKQWRLVKGL